MVFRGQNDGSMVKILDTGPTYSGRIEPTPTNYPDSHKCVVAYVGTHTHTHTSTANNYNF